MTRVPAWQARLSRWVSTHPRLLMGITWSLIIGLLLWLLPSPDQPIQQTSFPGYWLVAREVLGGTPATQLYDPIWLAARLAESGFPPDRMLGPPSLTLTAMPVALLPYPTARAIWTLAVLAPALVISLWWLARPLGPFWGAALGILFVSSQPVAAGMAVGQVYPLLLLAHCVALWAWQHDRAGISALGLAPMILMRGWYGLPQAFGWLVAGRWRAVLWIGLGLIAGVLATIPLLGWSVWWHFLRVSLPEAAGSETAMVLAYQTWRSLALHLTTFHPRISPDPPLQLLGSSLWLVGVLVVLGLSTLQGRRSGPGEGGIGFAMWTCTGLLLSPFAEDHHMVLTAVPASVLWREVPGHRPLIVLALLLLLPDIPFDQPALIGGWRSLLAYPRVYGVGLLWLVALLGTPLNEQTNPESKQM